MTCVTKIGYGYMRGLAKIRFACVHENTPMRHLTKLTYTHEGMHENTHMRGLTKIN